MEEIMELEKLILPDWGTRNVLGLSNANDLYCDIRHYRNSHALMRVRLYHPDPEYPQPPPQLIFFSPFYFEGPFTWQSCEINTAEKTDLLELLERLGWNINEISARRFENMRLYQIPIVTSSKPYTVQIIGWNIMVSNQRITIGMIGGATRRR
jgi:hypothetical protein